MLHIPTYCLFHIPKYTEELTNGKFFCIKICNYIELLSSPHLMCCCLHIARRSLFASVIHCK